MPSAGKVVAAETTVVGADSVRLDLWCYSPNEHPQEQRRTTIMDVTDAMALVVMLVRAIENAETNQAIRSKPAKQSKLPLKKGKR